MFTLMFKTANAAFGEDGPHVESARILRDIADRLEAGDDEGRARDLNGNTVGEWKLSSK